VTCPFLNEENMECRATHAQGGVTRPGYVKLTSSELEKCKTIWEKCPYYLAYS